MQSSFASPSRQDCIARIGKNQSPQFQFVCVVINAQKNKAWIRRLHGGVLAASQKTVATFTGGDMRNCLYHTSYSESDRLARALIYRRQRPGAVHSFGEAETRGWQGSSITTSLLGISPVPSQVGQTSPSGHAPIPIHVGHLIIFITVRTRM